jgi:L-ascorbate metabolism protein UlaG (beta-lactamase superfamily)
VSNSTLISPLTITHIGTATTLIELDDLKILTDPYFFPPGTEWLSKSGVKLVSKYQPALGLQDLPPVEVVLLSH